MKTSTDKFISGNAKVVRNVNRAVILNMIREKQPISRVKVAKLAGLNKSTVSAIVTGLLEENLIFEEEDSDNNVGRNPFSLRLKLGQHYVGAISINSSKTRVAVADIDGSFINEETFATATSESEEFIFKCVRELYKLRDNRNIKKLEGIGVSVAGIVDPVNAVVTNAPNLDWEDFEIGKLLRKACDAKHLISVDNDSKSAALAELWFGKHNNSFSDFVFLSVGPGIGTGIVVEKKLLSGRYHAAGEFGHMTLFEGGEPCTCGNSGCWEVYASDQATVKRYCSAKRIFPISKITLEEVMDKALNENEPEALDTLKRTGHFIGLGISNVVKAIDPEAIIIGGRITRAWDIISPIIMQTVESKSFFGEKHELWILPTSLESVRPQLLGAATLAIKELFTDYKITI